MTILDILFVVNCNKRDEDVLKDKFLVNDLSAHYIDRSRTCQDEVSLHLMVGIPILHVHKHCKFSTYTTMYTFSWQWNGHLQLSLMCYPCRGLLFLEHVRSFYKKTSFCIHCLCASSLTHVNIKSIILSLLVLSLSWCLYYIDI